MSESSKQLLIVGLGNPGEKYELTRHNMGYLVLHAFARMYGYHFKEEKQFSAYVAKGKAKETTVHLLLPTTYMNESGRAARRYLDFFKMKPENVVVVADDIAFPFGEMRVKSQGSAGGHNGLKSIEAHLGTAEYARLRLGIGQDKQAQTLADYVLDIFSKEELLELPQVLHQGALILNRLINENISQVMNFVNVKIKNQSRPESEGQEKKNE